jgi:hypothetical protein
LLWAKTLKSQAISGSGNERPAAFELTPANSYQRLLSFADKDLEKPASPSEQR